MCFTHVRRWRAPFLCFAILLGMIWPCNKAQGQPGAAISTDTQSGFLKSNQSKVFYHDGKWWAIALNTPDSRWYIWKFSGTAWAKNAPLDKSTIRKFDAVVNAAKGKLYLLGSHTSATEFRRFSYMNGSWTLDAGFPVNPNFINTDGNNPISLVQAKNGDLWIFRLEGNKLQAKRSIASDGGAKWSAIPINVKIGLNTATGTTDAVTFSFEGKDYIGVAFGEADNISTKFGFLRHQDGAPDISWKDESISLAFFGAERGNNQLCLTTDGNNNIYLLTKNGNALNSDPRNTLYKRTSGGTWQKFKVNTSVDWKSPALAFDAANNRLFVMGIGVASQKGEYKTCLIGQEASLETASATVFFAGTGAAFADLSAPPSGTSVDAASGLMMGADNSAKSDIWYNRLPIASIVPVKIDTITVTPRQVNANAAYKIPLKLSDSGALVAGAGTITLIFPNNTLVPDSVAAANIFVNGKPCTKAKVDAAARKLTITTPVSLSKSQLFPVVITAGARLLNPTLVGAYQVKATTSAQPPLAASPNYSLTAASSTVTPATVSLSTSETDSSANYTIAFKLGANGRMIAGTSTFTVTFGTATKIKDGSLTGVKVNGVAASATGNNTSKTVNLTLPASVPLRNSAAVSLYLPATAIFNPSVANNYTLRVATSVETKPVTSQIYKIIGSVFVGTVTVNPPVANASAAYSIPLKLSSNGALTAGAGALNFRFPVGTKVPSSITPNLISVNGTAATKVTANSATREVMVTTPVNLANSQNFSVVFNRSAGIINPPAAGDYKLQAWTSAQPTPVSSPSYALTPTLGGNPLATSTVSGYMKSNQSKVFYYATQWWAVAFDEPENKWYIWKYNGSTWTKAVGMDKGTAYNYDVVVNASANKIYLFAAHQSLSRFHRYSYAGGTWKLDAGFPVDMSDFVSDPNNPIGLVQAKNGDLWIFRLSASVLQAKRSSASDSGAKWSTLVTVKSGLQVANGTTDAVAFTAGDKNYIGVGFGASDVAKNQLGFLIHQDGAANNVWTDESAALTALGAERALNQISVTTDANQNVYLFVQNTAATSTALQNLLYKRSIGTWKKFKVNSKTAWKTPALAIDATNKILYLMGVNTNSLLGEYKTCVIGEEAKLDTTNAKVLFNAVGGKFDDLSAPAANVNSTSGLMICADNKAANDIYYRHLELLDSAPLSVGTIKVVSNQINANASYTIPLKLSSSGGLEAGSGVLNFIFPPNTYVPNNMPPQAVKVDGVPAKNVLSNSTTRQVTVTTPIKLPNDQQFSVVFDSAAGAGLLNSTAVGSTYRLAAWTSAQTKQVNSPPYGLVQATTKVTPASVKVFPTNPDSLAEYNFTFNLGAHGRLLSGTSTIRVKFSSNTRVAKGAIIGVKLNSKNAAATADSIARKITVTVPVDLSLGNNAKIALTIPRSKIRNPNISKLYTVLVSSSVETTLVASQPYVIKTSRSIGAAIAGTTKNFDRNNQSKVFYHDGSWWVTAQSKVDMNWYLWKFNGNTWTQSTLISSTGNSRPDCSLDALNNKVFILLPGSSTTYFTRLSYMPGKWVVDPGYPVAIPDFRQVSDLGINLTRAKNGYFWLFRATDSTLTARRSADQGQTWTPTIVVKKHLHTRDALTDATAFTLVSGNYIGAGYAENSASGSVYGFLRHLDTAADKDWIDETTEIPQFAKTTSDDHLSMLTYNGEVLMLIKTKGGGVNTINVGLLRRNWNGIWNQFPILMASGWRRPVMAIDETNKRLYVFGTREEGVKVGEMKKCALGDYAALLKAPIDTVFKNETENFFDASMPLHPVNSAMNLLICNGNDTRDELWYNLIRLGGAAKMDEEALTAERELVNKDFAGVQVFPNPFNPQTSFRFKVKEKAQVRLQIFNLAGQLVRTIVDEDLIPGVYQRRWNGQSQDGRPAATGLYFYRLQIGQQMLQGRIQMLK